MDVKKDLLLSTDTSCFVAGMVSGQTQDPCHFLVNYETLRVFEMVKEGEWKEQPQTTVGVTFGLTDRLA